MILEKRINAFAELGDFLSQFHESENQYNNKLKRLNDKFYDNFKRILIRAKVQNPWFTEQNSLLAVKGISKMLNKTVLEIWLRSYPTLSENYEAKRIGVIMAGNIPLVGFHDFLSVLISGHKLVAKLSSKDTILMHFVAEVLTEIEPDFKDSIILTNGIIKNIDAVIATGSDNSSRYFEYYFGKYPNIIRRNRSSAALLTGTETDNELQALGKDIFMYYGLGCRNVSKLFLPKGFDIQRLFKNFMPYGEIINHNKYANNFDYNRAVYLMNQTPFLENGFVMLKEDASYVSPISVVNYEWYEDLKSIKNRLLLNSRQIQCIVSNADIENAFPYGEAQFPAVDDYADGVDTLKFLSELS